MTEQVTGLDLVELMIQEAAGELPPIESLNVSRPGMVDRGTLVRGGSAKNFQPAPGKLTQVAFPSRTSLRVETWVENGTTVTPFYDPMIAKIIVTGEDRDDALAAVSLERLNRPSCMGSKQTSVTCDR